MAIQHAVWFARGPAQVFVIRWHRLRKHVSGWIKLISVVLHGAFSIVLPIGRDRGFLGRAGMTMSGAAIADPSTKGRFQLGTGILSTEILVLILQKTQYLLDEDIFHPPSLPHAC
jgi:hypothetical protein